MNKIILDQLNALKKTLEFQVDGKPSKDFPEFFSEVTFLKSGSDLVDTRDKTFIFEDYIIRPFEGFDFHDKFNNGIAPPEKVMVGKIIKETEKMYFIEAESLFDIKTWKGWVPKKSVKIDN